MDFLEVIEKRRSIRKYSDRPVEKEILDAIEAVGNADIQANVEEEINGLVTYDRAVQKIPTERMKAINDKLKAVWDSIE